MPPASEAAAALLEARALDTFYGQRQALFGISLSIAKGETIGLMGRNGMGKTTLVRTFVGLVRPQRGQVLLDGEDITKVATHAIARRGVAYVPEGRGIFASLNVAENLSIAGTAAAPGPWTLPRVLELFPRLAQRLDHRGDELSGGEQQMLAIGRALMTNPRLLLLDEATEGLAPLLREEIWRIIRLIRTTGMTTLIIDKTVAAVTAIADRIIILVKGEIVFQGRPDELKAQPDLMHRHLGV